MGRRPAELSGSAWAQGLRKRREEEAQQGQPGSALGVQQHTHTSREECGSTSLHRRVCLAAVSHSSADAICSHLCDIKLIVGLGNELG